MTPVFAELFSEIRAKQQEFEKTVVAPAQARNEGAQNNVRESRQQSFETHSLSLRSIFTATSGESRLREKTHNSDNSFAEETARDYRVKDQMLRSSQSDLSLAQEMLQRGNIERALIFTENSLRSLEGASPLDTHAHATRLQHLGKYSERVNANLSRTETGLRIARDGTIITGVTVATGGGATVYGFGAVTTTLFGFSTGAALSTGTILAEQGSNVATGMKSVSTAASEGAGQFATDLATSATAAVGASVSAPIAGPLVNRMATASSTFKGAISGEATRSVVLGGTSEGLSSAITTTLDHSARAVLETGETSVSAYAGDLMWNTTYGVLSGGTGAKFNAAAPAIKTRPLTTNAVTGLVGVAVTSTDLIKDPKTQKR